MKRVFESLRVKLGDGCLALLDSTSGSKINGCQIFGVKQLRVCASVGVLVEQAATSRVLHPDSRKTCFGDNTTIEPASQEFCSISMVKT